MAGKEDYFKSIWLKAVDIGDIGSELVAQIEYEAGEDIEDPQTNKSKWKSTIGLVGVEKPMILNKTNFESVEALYGVETDEWAGKWITLYVTQTEAFKKVHTVLRIRDSVPAPQAAPAPVPMMSTENVSVAADAAVHGGAPGPSPVAPESGTWNDEEAVPA